MRTPKIPGVFYKETRTEWWLKNSLRVLIAGAVVFTVVVSYCGWKIVTQGNTIIGQNQTIISSQATNHSLGMKNHTLSKATLKLERAYLKEQGSLKNAGSAQLVFAGWLYQVNEIECTFIHLQGGPACPTLNLTGIPGQK